MTRLICSNCSAELGVTLVTDRPIGTHRLLDDDRAAAVRSFIVGKHGRFVAGELLDEYDRQREAAGWPPLTAKAFGRALRVAGATSWRNSETRGWEL